MTQTTRQQLEEIGRAWGEQEVEVWRDQHESMETAPDWTSGTYCGDIHSQAGINPADRDSDDEATRRAYDAAIEAAEAVIDSAARAAWDEARAQYANPVRCTACGETCEYADAKHDEGYVYCPACVAADPELQ